MSKVFQILEELRTFKIKKHMILYNDSYKDRKYYDFFIQLIIDSGWI